MYLSPCGCNCEKMDCKDSCGGNCHACGGKPFYLKDFGVEICPIFDCAVNKNGYYTCAECANLPCQLYCDWKDPSNTDEEHVQSIKDRTILLKESRENRIPIRKILLTSAGFETKTISDTFLSLVGKEPTDIKVLFIPTAAIFPAAIEVLPKCMNDLLKIGIPAANIKVFDLHHSLSFDEMTAFDAVYFTGGRPQYLLERINDTGFNKPLNKFISKGGVYIGVSAGAIVGAGNLPNNLGYLKATINVHMQDGMEDGIFNNDAITHIDLKNDRAILIHNEQYKII